MKSYKKFLENYIPCKEFLVCPENKKQRHIINPFPALTKRLIQNQLEIWRKIAQNNGYDIEYKIIEKDEKQYSQEIKEK